MPRTPCAHLLTNVQYLRAVAVTFTPVLLAVASHLSRSSSPGTIVGKPSCTRLLWHQFSRQYTPGHRTVFSLKFTIGIFAGLCLVLFAGGSIFLSQSLALVQIRAVYSDSPPLSNYSNEERSLLMQGQGTADWCKNCRCALSAVIYSTRLVSATASTQHIEWSCHFRQARCNPPHRARFQHVTHWCCNEP